MARQSRFPNIRHFNTSDTMNDRLDQVATETDKNVPEVIREAITFYFAHLDAQANRDDNFQEALKLIKHFDSLSPGAQPQTKEDVAAILENIKSKGVQDAAESTAITTENVQSIDKQAVFSSDPAHQSRSHPGLPGL